MRTMYGYSELRQNAPLETIDEIVSFVMSDGTHGNCRIIDWSGCEVLQTAGVNLQRCLPAMRVLLCDPLEAAQKKASRVAC